MLACLAFSVTTVAVLQLLAVDAKSLSLLAVARSLSLLAVAKLLSLLAASKLLHVTLAVAALLALAC